jgi:hypothetical protein
MNRSILIVICDFLLLSLLTFSTDINRMASDDTQRSARPDVATNEVVQPGKDLMALMNQALADERKGREQLQQQLATAQSTSGAQQQALTQAQQENARLQQQSAGLQEQYAAAQTNLENTARQLQAAAAQAQAAQQQRATTQAEQQKQNDSDAELRRKLKLMTQSNLLAQAAAQRLASQLQLTEAEKNLMQQDVQVARTENARLAEGFKSLATNSSQLTQEIRENTALAPNNIFNQFVTNRVQTSIYAARTGFLGMDASKSSHTETILVTDGRQIYAICHVDDTPLALWDPGTDWEGLTGTLAGHGGQPVPIKSISFHEGDPRVVMFPVTPAEAQQLGCKVYRISNDPYKFQDAVLVGADDGYYGQCDFQIELNTPQYVRLDRSLLKGLFGKFNPSRGDVVFSRTGQFLGVMVNSTYCLMIKDFPPAATLAFSSNVRNEHTGTTLARLYDGVFQMPQRLQ